MFLNIYVDVHAADIYYYITTDFEFQIHLTWAVYSSIPWTSDQPNIPTLKILRTLPRKCYAKGKTEMAYCKFTSYVKQAFTQTDLRLSWGLNLHVSI